MKGKNRWLCTLVALGRGLAIVTLAASSPSFAAGGADREGCSDMDFILGDWKVLEKDGSVRGGASFTAGVDHCTLRETFFGADGEAKYYVLYVYSAPKKNWAFFAGAANGYRLHYDFGTWKDNAIEFQLVEPVGPENSRFSYVKNADGSIQEVQETTTDGGVSWQVDYDLRWVRPTQ
jgi:hypothetical protein